MSDATDVRSFAPLATALADRYRIERELGQAAWRRCTSHTTSSTIDKVALKVLSPDLAASLGHERFLREITNTANLRHPHILPLFDSGEAGSFSTTSCRTSRARRCAVASTARSNSRSMRVCASRPNWPRR